MVRPSHSARLGTRSTPRARSRRCMLSRRRPRPCAGTASSAAGPACSPSCRRSSRRCALARSSRPAARRSRRRRAPSPRPARPPSRRTGPCSVTSATRVWPAASPCSWAAEFMGRDCPRGRVTRPRSPCHFRGYGAGVGVIVCVSGRRASIRSGPIRICAAVQPQALSFGETPSLAPARRTTRSASPHAHGVPHPRRASAAQGGAGRDPDWAELLTRHDNRSRCCTSTRRTGGTNVTTAGASATATTFGAWRSCWPGSRAGSAGVHDLFGRFDIEAVTTTLLGQHQGTAKPPSGTPRIRTLSPGAR